MIPSIKILSTEIVENIHPSKTYRMVSDVNGSVPTRINGYIDDLESIEQAIYLILSTERYAYIIYSWDYGIELVDLFGKPMSYVMSELPRRIKEALTMDDRIDDVTNFEFEKDGKKLHTKFTVITKLGEINTELEFDI